jgi:FkbM family methyltransferase
MANCTTVTAKHGTFLVTANDGIGLVLKQTNDYEPHLYLAAKNVVKPGDTVIDCGANFGYHSIALANLAGPEGKIVAIEPLRQVYQQLCGNIFLNNIRHGWCLNYALGDEIKNVEMEIANLDASSTTNIGATRVGSNGDKVEMTTLDTLISKGIIQEDKVSFIKIDVEGLEIKVLNGACRLLEKSRPVMMIENIQNQLLLFGGSSEMLCKTLLDKKYHIFTIHSSVDIFAIPEEKLHLMQPILDDLEQIGWTRNIISVLRP